MIIELPCGLIQDGVVYDHVKISELRGKQQNYLVDAELVTDNFGHIPKMLADLVTDYQTKEGQPLDIEPKEAVWMVPTEDIEVMLLKIREATFGAKYAMPTVCFHCDKQQMKKIDLDKLEVKNLPGKKKIREKVIKLSRSGIEAEIKLLYLKDLFKIHEALRDSKSELFTATVFLSLKRLGKKTPVEAVDLDDIPVRDIQEIEKAYLKMRGSIDLMITHECDYCKKEYDNPLGVMDPLFFVQSQTLST